MGANSSKFKVLCLPAQSGKTRKMTELIESENTIKNLNLFKEFSNAFGSAEKTVNFIISSNNKMLVQQTQSRLKKDIGAKIEGNVFSWMSGNSKNNIKVKELAWDIISGAVEIVVCCAHRIRVKYMAELITELEKLQTFNKKINIWVDEGDKSIDTWSKHEHILSFNCVQQFSPISATIDAIHKKYSDQYSVFQFENVYADCYKGLKDCNHVIEDILAKSATDYIEKVIDKNKIMLLKPGVRMFIPGDPKKKCHEDISKILVSKGVVVAIFNGDHREIRFPNGDRIDLKPYLSANDSELSDTLSRVYVQNNLHDYPFAITGYMCIQRGITFQTLPKNQDHNGFLFDYGIIPPITCKSETYQVMARMFGNIGHSPHYKKSTIFSTSSGFSKVSDMESIAFNIARLYPEGKMIGDDDMKMAKNPEEEKKKTIPIVISVDQEFIKEIQSLKGSKRSNKVLEFLKRDYPDMYKDHKIKQVTIPETESSYKKHIIDVASHWEQKKRFKIDIDMKTEACENIMNVYIDTKIPRILFVIWNGKIPSEIQTEKQSLNPFLN